jgi:hypothetical protein
MRGRPLIFALWLCSTIAAAAQDTGNLPLVGVLRLNTPENVEPIPTIFRNALAALGHVDGRNIRIEFRLAAGHAERFPELARALVHDKAQQKPSRSSRSSTTSSLPGWSTAWPSRGATPRE